MCVGRERRFAVCFSKIYELMQIAHAGSSCMCVRFGCLRHSNEFEESISEVDISDSLMSIPLISDVYDIPKLLIPPLSRSSSVEITLSEVCSLHGVLFDIRMSLVPPQKD
jgi:hypothetical protein